MELAAVMPIPSRFSEHRITRTGTVALHPANGDHFDQHPERMAGPIIHRFPGPRTLSGPSTLGSCETEDYGVR